MTGPTIIPGVTACAGVHLAQAERDGFRFDVVLLDERGHQVAYWGSQEEPQDEARGLYATQAEAERAAASVLEALGRDIEAFSRYFQPSHFAEYPWTRDVMVAKLIALQKRG